MPDPGNRRRDALAELRSSWRAIEAPRWDRELADEDAATRAVVDRLRADWRTADTTAAAAASRAVAARLAARHRTRFRRARIVGAAAAVFAAVALWLVATRRAAFAPTAPPVACVPEASVSPPPAAAQVVAVGPDRVEVLAGRVRVILVAPFVATAPAPPQPRALAATDHRPSRTNR